MPNSIIESMAMGIPVIANPSGGIVELVEHGFNGYLFPFKRPDILSEQIIFLLENEDIRKEIGLNSISRVNRRFSIEGMARNFETLYDNCIQDKIETIHQYRKASE
jgi:glycosyltransferase involved in cell wall biosynthesis